MRRCFSATALAGYLLAAVTIASSITPPNWEVYEVHGDVSLQECIDFVLGTPVRRYWDTKKSEFRVGMLGADLNESHPDLVMTIPRSFMVDSSMEIEYVLVPDAHSVLMRTLAVIQYLGERGNSVASQIQDFKREKDDFALKIIRIASETGREWRTAAEIKAAREVLQQRLHGLEMDLKHENDMHGLKIENLNIKHKKRRAMRDEHHEKLLSLRREHEQVLVSLKLQRQNESVTFSRQVFEQEYKEKERLMIEEFRFNEERLMNEINFSIDAIRFRSQEEIRVERENEEVAAAVIRATGELQIQRVQTVVDTFFVEIASRLKIVLGDPKAVGIGAAVVVVLLAVVVIVAELFNSGKALLKALLRRSSLLTTVGAVSDSSAGSGDSRRYRNTISADDIAAKRQVASDAIKKHIIASTDTINHVSDLVVSMQLSKADFTRHSALRNILITAAPGNGKSTMAKTIAIASGIEYAVVSGSDLRAHGGGADKMLYNILDACVAKSINKRQKFLLIMDDIDAIALDRYAQGSGARSPARRTPKKGISDDRKTNDEPFPSMKSCIHLLLTTFKNNSEYLSLIATSSSPAQTINAALLDRIDDMVVIDSPTREQRLQCCVVHTDSLLFRYMSEEERKTFKTIFSSVLESSDFSLFRQIADQAPETQVPMAEASESDVGAKKPSSNSRKARLQSSNSDNALRRDLDISSCLARMAQCSAKWSYRDIVKTLQSIQCEVLGTSRCVLTTDIWMNEVRLAVQKWNR